MGLSLKDLRKAGVRIPHADTMTRPIPKRNVERGKGKVAMRKRLILADKGRDALVFTLPYPPATNNLYLTRGKHRVLSPQARAYKKDVLRCIYTAQNHPFACEVEVRIDLYRSSRHIDIDNIKIVPDSLKGIAFLDDYQMRRLVTEKHRDERERVEISVRPFVTER